jgi:hypothetical protein
MNSLSADACAISEAPVMAPSTAPICIAGMHRSGTSMIARLLNVRGIYLGPDEDLFPATPDNPEGHWEHATFVRINEEILATLGAGWDYPPDASSFSENGGLLAPLEEEATLLLHRFDGQQLWGWKDPRTSLTLPFWQKLIDDLKVVVCVRNPLEVAESLHRRGMSSYAFGLALWRTYNERLLAETTPSGRVVTHYLAYFNDPPAEIQRIGRRLQFHVSEAIQSGESLVARSELRHHHLTIRDMVSSGVPADIVDLYRRLCEEAEFSECRA